VEILKYIVIWIIIIFVHELGHYLAFKYYKYKPKLKVRWQGIITVGENVRVKTIRQSHFILLWGVFAGLIPTILFFGIFSNNAINVLFYYFLSSVDLSQILLLAMLSKSERKMSWLEYHACQIEKLQKSEA